MKRIIITIVCIITTTTSLLLARSNTNRGEEKLEEDCYTDSLVEKKRQEEAIDIKYLKQKVTTLENDWQSEKKNNKTMLPIILSLIALGISGYALAKLLTQPLDKRKQDMSTTTNQESTQTIISTLTTQVNQLNQQISPLQEAVNEIKKQLSLLDNKQNNTKQTLPQLPTQQPSQPPTQPQQTVFQKQTKFAETIGSDGISQNDLIDTNSEYAYLKIIIDSPTTASFVINDLQTAQAEIISSYDYTIKPLVNRLRASSAPKTIVTHNPGRLMLQGDKWVVTKKADISLD